MAEAAAQLAAAAADLKKDGWRAHGLAGHIAHRALSEAVDKGLLTGMDKKLASVIRDLESCNACIRGKGTRPPFPVVSSGRQLSCWQWTYMVLSASIRPGASFTSLQ